MGRMGKILFLVSFFSVSSLAQESYTGPIIDVHQHSEWEWSDNRFCFPAPCTGKPTQVSGFEELKPLTMAAMDKYNIVLAVVSAPPEYVLPWTDGERNRLLTGIQVNNPEDLPLEELRQYFVSGRAQVLGELALQYEGIAIDDPSVDPMLSMAEELNIPVHVHILGVGGQDNFAIELGNPIRIASVMRRHPKLRIYLENAAWPYLQEVTSLMYQYPTVYADISTITHVIPREVFHEYLRGLIKNGLGKRLMFGSDQMLWPEVIEEAIEAIDSASFLTTEQKADIFFNNAARFLRLSDQEMQLHQRGQR